MHSQLLNFKTMKKVVTVHIANEVFQMEEDGYNKIQKVLKKIETGSNKGSSAIKDIEIKLAVQLREKATTAGLVTCEQVDDILDSMGYSAYLKEEWNQPQDKTYSGGYRRLYRNPTDKVLGGVCSGLAAYFDSDPVLLRIVFVVLFFIGIGFLLYLIMWIVVPQARTPEQINDINNQRI